MSLTIFRVAESHPCGGLEFEAYYLKPLTALLAFDERVRHHKKTDMVKPGDCVHLDYPVIETSSPEKEKGGNFKSAILEVWTKTGGEEPEWNQDILHLDLYKIEVNES